MTELEVRLEIAKLAAVQKGSFDLVFDEIAAKVFGKPQGSDLALVFETVGVAEAIADLERLEAVLLRVEKLKDSLALSNWTGQAANF